MFSDGLLGIGRLKVWRCRAGLYGLRVLGGGFAVAQVVVEYHGDVADEEAAFGRYLQAVPVQFDQPQLRHLFQVFQFGGEILFERYAEDVLVNVEVEGETAHQVLNDVAAQDVVFIQLVAAHNRQAALVDGGVVVGDVAFVLFVGAADFADGGYADGDEVAVGIGGIALEVALQKAFAQGNRKFVVGFGEMVHADEDVACFGQALHGVLQDIEFFFAAGNGIGVDAALGFEYVRQVGVVVECEAVGVQAQYGVYGGFDAF